MDLRLSATVPATADERSAVDGVLGPPETGWDGGQRTAADGHVAFGGHAARSRRHLLLEVLHAVQERAGWISPGALDYVCERLTVPPAEAYGVASFYAMFRTVRSPGAVVHVCDDIACQTGGAENLCEQMRTRFGAAGTEAPWRASANGSTADGTGVTWQRSPCLGQCDRGSAALIQRASATVPGRTQIAPASVDAIWQTLADGSSRGADEGSGGDTTVVKWNGPSGGLLSRIGQIDPASLGAYRAAGGYQMLRRAIGLGPQGVLREVKDAKLLGRGGAAFPTAIKWEAVAANPVRPHYVICNADESEPGTFK
ncbi:MAG: NAD(P)H-dependent oxidoreductase subunit E, partial [Trebonia sp.]